MPDPVEQRRIGSKLHNACILLNTCQKRRLCQCTLQCIFFILRMGCIFSCKYRNLPWIAVVQIHMIIHPLRRYVIMLIHCIAEIRIRLLAVPVEVPCKTGQRCIKDRPCRSEQPHIRVYFMNCLFKQLMTFKQIEIFCLPLLISNGDHIKTKRLRMPHLRTETAPLAPDISICKLDQIQCILNVLLECRIICTHHLRCTELACRAKVQYRKRLRSKQLAQQEILIKTNAIGLSIVCIRALYIQPLFAPVIIKRPEIRNISTIFPFTDCLFPAITVCKADSFHNTAAREADKARSRRFQCFKQIFAEHACHCVARDHRNQIEFDHAGLLKCDHKLCMPCIFAGMQYCLIRYPVVAAGSARLVHLMDRLNLLICYAGLHLDRKIRKRKIRDRFYRLYLCTGADVICTAHFNTEIFSLILHTSRIKSHFVIHAFFQKNSVIGLIRESLSCTCRRKTQVVRIHLGNRITGHKLQPRLPAVRSFYCRPAVSAVVHRIKIARRTECFLCLKRAVFDHLRIKPPVCRKIDILKKQSDHIR